MRVFALVWDILWQCGLSRVLEKSSNRLECVINARLEGRLVKATRHLKESVSVSVSVQHSSRAQEENKPKNPRTKSLKENGVDWKALCGDRRARQSWGTKKQGQVGQEVKRTSQEKCE